ncbi:MAG TPA: BPSS1780 family membrane protein [Ramlibacter sp.]
MRLNIVPARTGLQWIKLGVRTFLRQPLALAGLFFMYMTVVIVIAQIPVIGVFIGGLLVPAATLGLMAATEEASKGRFPMPSVLLSAFRAGRQRVRAMLVLGLVYTIASWLVTRLAALLFGEPDPGMQIDGSAILALALHIPLFLMFWHAPALVHWHGVTPAKSLFFSLVACLRNFGAYFVYGLGWLGLFIATGMLFALVGGMLGGTAMARAVMMPLALLLAAMFSTSIYFTFRDSFVASGEPGEEQHQEAP